MPLSVQSAFNQFRGIVDIETERYKMARASREFLTEKITALSKNDPSFPKVTGRYIPFGSLARRTKIDPLDDIDLLVVLNAQSVREVSHNGYPYDPYRQRVKVGNSSAPLAAYADDGYVNSIRVINRMKSEITKLHNYKNSDVKRNLQAVTLQLKTQPWNFDLVPTLAVGSVVNGTTTVTHYLIPNGSGDWMRTDPRKNASDTTAANGKHNGLLIPTIRVLKYWNRMTHKPRLGSFYFETLAIKVFQYAPTITTIRGAVRYFFENCPTYLNMSCPSPTGHGPNLDAGLDREAKSKVVKAMQAEATDAYWALYYEAQGDTKNALAYWRRVFGPSFPVDSTT